MMDKQRRIKLGFDKTALEKIRDKIFFESTEYKYYLLGISQGMFSIYKMLDDINNKGCKTPSTEELMKIIEKSTTQEDTIKKYFYKLLDELD